PDIKASGDDLQKRESQLTRVRPIKAGVRFEFTIHFENLHPAELGALLWVLEPQGEPEAQYRHKLGMGKPLGMGAVHITPALFISDRRQRYSQLLDGDKWATGETKADHSDYQEKFEKYILNAIPDAPEKLAKLDRIAMLLAMLQWREDTKEWQDKTRYMEIERDIGRRETLNEYAHRPVLPDPLAVTGAARSKRRKVRNPVPVADGRQSGRLKSWSDRFGFIIPDGGGKDVFIHVSQLPAGASPSEGLRLRYRTEPGPKGPRAIDVILAEEE
ncbi:MAG: cold shock domain-containing protein, partial [Anaerolineales bacterium]|nr:cold shock domain-containing protein [Anaerolineales bacterium]